MSEEELAELRERIEERDDFAYFIVVWGKTYVRLTPRGERTRLVPLTEMIRIEMAEHVDRLVQDGALG